MKHLIFQYYFYQIRVLLADLTGAPVSFADQYKFKVDQLLSPRLVCHSDRFVHMAGADEPALVGSRLQCVPAAILPVEGEALHIV